MPRNEITDGPGGTTFAGPLAVDVYRMATIARGIELFGKTGMKPTRFWKQTDMIKYAGTTVGRAFKRSEWKEAADALRQHSRDSAAAINAVNEVTGQ